MNVYSIFKVILPLSMAMFSLYLHAQDTKALDTKPLDKQSVRITAQQQRTMGIQVVPLRTADEVASLRLPAEVVIPVHQQRIVSAVQGGLVDAVEVAVGMQVKTGQVLGHMTTSDMLAPQQQYLQARIQQQLAQKTYERDAELFKDGIIAERRYLGTKSQLDEVRASVTQLRQLLSLGGMSPAAIAQLEKTGHYSTGMHFIAPMDGEITEQTVAVGQRVEPATMLFKIAKLTPLWLEIRTPIEQASGISKGVQVRVPKFGVEGSVVTVIRSLNKQDQTVLIRAEITQNAGALSPGQWVEAQFIRAENLTRQSPPFLVAKSAITRHGPQPYVFVKNTTGFSPVAVTVVAEQGQMATIQPVKTGALTHNQPVAVVGTVAIKAAWDAQNGAQ